jgi:signal peptidase I
VIFFSVAEGAHAWELWRWPWVVRRGRLMTMAR